jgi:nickel/cobalt transporter (NicO) family protein
MMRRLLLLALGAAVVGVLLLPAQPASAHPLGNFTVNQYEGLALRPDRVEVSAVVDAAELPTRQERPLVGADPSGYAARTCGALAGSFDVRIGRDRLQWTVAAASFVYRPGTGGLDTSRLECALRAPARLASATTVTVTNHYLTDRVGWRELTATADGVRLVDPPLPATSVSDELRAYPADLLSSALDQTSATLHVAPGSGTSTGPAVVAPRGSDPLSRLAAVAERRFQLLAGGHLTPLVGILAVLLAVLLGAGHAALPGHGKTVLAAYLAGRQGRPRDAVAVGAMVTLTHTGAVLAVGLLLSVSTALAGDRLLGYLGLVSGVLIVAVGGWMLVTSLRHARAHRHHHHHDHSHGRWSLAGIGLAGGLVPSPSALVVLLGAIGLGRAGFGVLLVLAYGLGMAGTLVGAGLLLLAVQRRVARAGWAARLARFGARFRATGTTATAALVVLVGLGLSARALLN